MTQTELMTQVMALNARYAASLDRGDLEDWPRCFTEDGMYRVTSADNRRAGHQASLIYARGQGMLKDRVQALREANIYERQSYRHVIGMPLAAAAAEEASIETPFVVVRTMRTGRIDVFATGVYLDTVTISEDGAALRDRMVVCDSSRIDTLLAIPL